MKNEETNANAKRRYARHEEMPLIGRSGAEALRQKTAAIIGCGNLGGQCAPHLAMHGVDLILVDYGVVEAENLGTQGFLGADAGWPKVEARARQLRLINPDSNVTPLHLDIRRMGPGILREADVVICALDTSYGRMLVNQMAWQVGKPWIDGALDGSGETLFGRVAAYDPRPEESPCMLCSWDADNYARLAHEQGETCGSLLGVGDGETPTPTLSTSSMGGVVAGIMAIQAIKLMLGDTTPVGAEVCVNLTDSVFYTSQSTFNDSCRFDHKTYTLTPTGVPPERLTIGDLFGLAENALGTRVSLELHHKSITMKLRCPLGHSKALHKVAYAISEDDIRCKCGAELYASGFDSLHAFDRNQASPFIDMSCADVGIPEQDIVTAVNGSGKVHFLIAER